MSLVASKAPTTLGRFTLEVPTSLRVARRLNGSLTSPERISSVERNNCRVALDVARMAPDMHGGNGNMGEYHVMRHAQNPGTVNTYEGTPDVHTLSLGRARRDCRRSSEPRP